MSAQARNRNERFRWLLCGVAAGCVFAWSDLGGQQTNWKVLGNTGGAPQGCSTSAAVAAIDRFFAAMREVDSAALGAALAPVFVFSISPLAPGEKFFVARSLPDLLQHGRKYRRARQHMDVEAVFFNGWRQQALEFGPIYFVRTDDGVSRPPRRGAGKGTYKCGQGVSVMNLGARPINDLWPGPFLPLPPDHGTP
jgi:hypothetical protein